jgi:hypothetical protein
MLRTWTIRTRPAFDSLHQADLGQACPAQERQEPDRDLPYRAHRRAARCWSTRGRYAARPIPRVPRDVLDEAEQGRGGDVRDRRQPGREARRRAAERDDPRTRSRSSTSTSSNDPTPDGLYGYKIVVPTGPINGIQDLGRGGARHHGQGPTSHKKKSHWPEAQEGQVRQEEGQEDESLLVHDADLPAERSAQLPGVLRLRREPARPRRSDPCPSFRSGI